MYLRVCQKSQNGALVLFGGFGDGFGRFKPRIFGWFWEVHIGWLGGGRMVLEDFEV